MKSIRYLASGIAAGLLAQAPASAQAAPAAAPAAPFATDPALDPEVRTFLIEFNKNPVPFWTYPQPQPQQALTDLQNKTPVDMTGVSIIERTITQDGRKVKVYVMTPTRKQVDPGVILFLHGAVWIAGNFENHQRLLRDLVVGSGQVGVFVEYTPLPLAKYPTQLDESFAALKWVAAHGNEIGADGSRIAVAGNSVGGNLTAALTLMAKDRKGPKISYQVMMIPATDASVDSPSYLTYGKDRFLGRDFMKYGWDHYVTDAKLRDNRYVSPLRASESELRGLPPALVITAENDPLRDEGEAYARKMKRAGVNVDAIRYTGTIHDFVTLNALRNVPTTVSALNEVSDGIRSHIGR